jgi:predicted Zn-dependent protease
VIVEHLASLRASEAPSPLAAEVHWVVALYLQAALRLEDLMGHFKAMGGAFGSDARLLLAEGTLHETLASRRLEPARRAGLVPSARSSLAAAAGFLRRADAQAPGQDEARVRLAHVLIQQGNAAEAVTVLDSVLTSASSPSTRYLARMHIGRVHADASRLEDARRAFTAAHDELPCAQSALVALAHLGLLDGQPAGARALLDPSLGDSEGCRDPWAFYDFGQEASLEDVIVELRRRLAR